MPSPGVVTAATSCQAGTLTNPRLERAQQAVDSLGICSHCTAFTAKRRLFTFQGRPQLLLQVCGAKYSLRETQLCLNSCKNATKSSPNDWNCWESFPPAQPSPVGCGNWFNALSTFTAPLALSAQTDALMERKKKRAACQPTSYEGRTSAFSSLWVTGFNVVGHEWAEKSAV